MLRHTLFKNKPLYSTLARRAKLAINFFVPCSKAISSSTSLPIGVALMTSPFPKVLCCTISPVLNTFPLLAGGDVYKRQNGSNAAAKMDAAKWDVRNRQHYRISADVCLRP